MPLKVSDIGEKGLIKRILKKTNKNLINSSFFDNLSFKSLNDDAALINFGDNYLVATSDMLFKSTHFPDEMTPHQIGKKLITVNVSDLAAMGAKAIGIIVSIGLPKDMLLDDFDSLMDGITEGCLNYNMTLIGGDTNESSELTLCGTCLGIVNKKDVLMKDGAKPGDVVAITGPLGLAAAGFQVLFNNLDIDFKVKEKLLKYALDPEAKSEEGILLAETSAITSATDITDGLASEIGEIVDASSYGIGISIYEEMIPMENEVLEVAQKTGKEPLDFILYYGEDFELLLTIQKDEFKRINDKVPIFKIGKVTSSGKIIIVNKDGTQSVLKPQGYEHLTK
ncbi:thiamine-phosphate kinase [Methanobacterium oryzae]|uniref:thiamine-phosphate kinase n=1 Tax=Methanobacterium oryzae TaxID=69540 RepID=UPI003D1E0F07